MLPEALERQTVDVATLAPILGVQKATIYRAIAEGRAPFPVIRVGDRLLISKIAIQRLLSEGVVADIDLQAARAYLAETLPVGQPVEIQDPAVLDAAAAVLVGQKAAV